MAKETISAAEKAELRKEKNQWLKFIRRMEKLGALIPPPQNQNNGNTEQGNN